MRTAIGAATAIALFASALATRQVEAHDPIPSKYTFNEDVHPILSERCGRCHVEGGPAPMPVTTYAKVRPWAEAIREQLLQGAMPPSFVDPAGPAIAGSHGLSGREVDTLLTWAAGGTPEGDRSKAVAAAVSSSSRDTPDATFLMDAPYTLVANTQDETREFDLRTSFSTDRWITRADVLPGTRSMVRDAQIATEDGTVLGSWIAGEPAMAAPSGTAFHLTAGAVLRLRLHYRKSWEDGPVARSDRSAVALYFTQAPPAGKSIRTVSASRMDAAVRVLAVRPTLREPAAAIDVSAIAPGGRRVPLLQLRSAQPGWPRRYWLVTPVDLKAGSQIVVMTSPDATPVEVALDVVTP